MGSTSKCSECGQEISKKYMPMEEWKIKGPMCGVCYSKRIHDHYPGDHIRVNLND